MLSTFILALGAAIFLYLLPGLGLLCLVSFRALDWGERVGLAAGLSVALYPVLFLAASVLGVAAGPALAWIPGGLGLLILLTGWGWRMTGRGQLDRPDMAEPPDRLPPLLLGLTLLLLLAVRLTSIQGMTAPAWGDSVHHTFIVQLILDHGGLFQSWQPYAPIASMTYHFGFHANAAVWAWLTGLDAPASVLQAGQALNVMAVLVLYPLGKRMGGSAWAGLLAVVVAGALFPLPGYYVNWGRYTQLAGQVILLPALWLVDGWWRAAPRPGWPHLALLTLLILGLGLTHYRVALLMISAGAAWGLWGAWQGRASLREWAIRLGQLILAGGAAGLLFLPWLQVVLQGKLARIAAGIVAAGGTADASAEVEMAVWGTTSANFPDYFWMAALIATVAALIWRRDLAVPLILWGGLSFLLTNPHLIGLPGTGIVSNFALVIAMYIPIGLLLGWAGGFGLEKAQGKAWRAAAGTVLVVGALGVGLPQQNRLVDPFFQMVTPQDLAAFDWIHANTPADAYFLVNGFLVYGESSVVGSDAGWWLAYYTGRASSVPPVMYVAEALEPGVTTEQVRAITAQVRESHGEAHKLTPALCRAGITHVYLGQRRGSVGHGQTELIPEHWLMENPQARLLFRADLAQVWAFDRSVCDGDLSR